MGILEIFYAYITMMIFEKINNFELMASVLLDSLPKKKMIGISVHGIMMIILCLRFFVLYLMFNTYSYFEVIFCGISRWSLFFLMFIHF